MLWHYVVHLSEVFIAVSLKLKENYFHSEYINLSDGGELEKKSDRLNIVDLSLVQVKPLDTVSGGILESDGAERVAGGNLIILFHKYNHVPKQ